MNPLRNLRRALAQARRRIRLRLQLGRERLPVARLDELFPAVRTVCVTVAGEHLCPQPRWTLPLLEALSLGAICRVLEPRTIFEIGTFRGATTRHLALNSPASATVYTLDLPPAAATSGKGRKFDLGSEFAGRPEESKIRQLLGDSAEFDFAAYRGDVDLVFIDGDHSYEAVARDTRTALDMVAPGGAVVWDDYHPEWGAGVMRCLEENRELGLSRIAGTRLVVYRRG